MKPLFFAHPIVLIGFGSVGRGLLPLLLRHFDGDPGRITVIDPDAGGRAMAEVAGARFWPQHVTPDNYRQLLDDALGIEPENGFILQLANEVSSLDLMAYAATRKVHYLDTVVEPWPGFYFTRNTALHERTNTYLRAQILALKQRLGRTRTALSCCGANPGMVSWLLKRALLNLARSLDREEPTPTHRADWAALMQGLGVKGVQIAECDTQRLASTPDTDTFANTWSPAGFLAEALQPAELGWGSHEGPLPANGHRFPGGCGASVYLDQPGGATRVKTWTPSAGAVPGFLITHNEALSIADYYTIENSSGLVYRPSCFYAYRPCDAATTGLEALFGTRGGLAYQQHVLMSERDIVSGHDELGVLLYGHPRGAYWYGSRLSIDEARRLAPHQNATGLQVSSAIIAAMAYAISHPFEGVLEADEMDHDFCLQQQLPYLGVVSGHFTNWTPDGAWRFENFRINAID